MIGTASLIEHRQLQKVIHWVHDLVTESFKILLLVLKSDLILSGSVCKTQIDSLQVFQNDVIRNEEQP